MKKNKKVYYRCTLKWCKTLIPENDPAIQEQKKHGIVYCPKCGSPMMRKTVKG